MWRWLMAGTVCLMLVGCSSTVDGSVVAGRDLGTSPPAAKPPTTPRAPGQQGRVQPADLPGLLVSVDELRTVMNAPTLAVQKTWTEFDAAPGVTFAPPECLGATFSGMAPTYQGSGQQAFYALTVTEPGMPPTGPVVDQGVVAFPDPAAAAAMVSRSAEEWRACAGKPFTATQNGAPVGAWTLGAPSESAGMITLSRVADGSPGWTCVHAMAAKANVVVDNQVCRTDLADQPAVITNNILARIPG